MAITLDGIFINGQKATFHPEDILSGDASAYTEEIGTAVEEWLEENVTGGEQVTDTTLTLPGVPADAKKVGDEIGELKEDLNRYQENTFRSPIRYNITSNTWTVGQGVSPTTGANMTNAKYARTDYIRFSKPTLLYFDDSNYDFIVWEYSAQSVSSAEFAPRGYYGDEPVIISVEQDATDFRVGVKRKDNTDISASDITVLVAKLKTFILTDNTLTLSNVPADAKKTGDEIASIIKDLNAYGIIDYNKHLPKTTVTNAGITYAYDSTNNRYTYSGTAGTGSWYVLILQKPFVDFKAGVPFHVVYDSTDDNVYLQIYSLVGETSTLIEQNIKDKWVTLPSNATGVLIRARTLDNATVNGYFTIDIKGFYTREEISNVITALDTVEAELPNKLGYVKVLTSDDDMDDYGDTGAYCYLNSDKPTHAPEDQNNGVVVVIHGYNSTGFTSQIVTTNGNKFYFRNRFSSGYWTPWKELTSFEAELSEKLGYVKVLTSEDDMDDYGNTGAYCYLNSNKPANAPSDENSGVVTVIHGFNNTGFATQIVTTNGNKFYFRNRFTSGYWTPWKELTSNDGEAGDTIIENTYNITTSPTITTDTNGWLQAVDTDTSDETGKTDMTGAIMSMLADTGYCHLGEGIFYVSGNIDMPDGSTLCGCGKNTVIRLLQSTTTGYCVKIGKYCTIKDISFEGARSFSMPSTKGTRNGIAFMANYDASPSVTTEHCMISNVWLRYFSGAGIYCHNTGIRYDKGVYAVNVFIYTCYVGIDIDYYSEFNKFTNVCTSWCKIGCINNGGNNVFTACTFHASDTGFYIDGTQPNSAHGTITGCTFCHIGSNQGKAINIENVGPAGFIINACQFWYNSINITNSQGIIISNCEMGRGTTGAGATIVITGGDTVMFVGCMFMDDVNRVPDITITNNTKVKFVNCYGSVSGNAITA